MVIVVLMSLLTMSGICLIFWKTMFLISMASVVGAFNGVTILYLVMTGRLKIKLCWLMSCGLSLGYGLGSVNTIYSLSRKGVEPFVQFGLDNQSVGFAMLMVMFCCAVLLFAGCIEPAIFYSKSRVRLTWRVERFLWIQAALFAFCLASGRVGYMGESTGEGGKVSVISDLVLVFHGVGAPMALIGFLQSEGRRKARYGFLVLFFVLTALPLGRRVFFYNLIVSVLMAVNFSGVKTAKWSFVKQAGIVAVIYVSSILSNYYFMALRMSMDEQYGVSVVLASSATFDLLLNHRSDVTERLSENIQSRTFVLSYLAMLGHGGQIPPPVGGEDIKQAVAMTIPDVAYLVVDKSKNPVRANGSEEYMFNTYFGVSEDDMANSILTAGIIDFGIVGMLFYPVFFCAGYHVLVYLLGHLVNEEGQIAVLIPLISLTLLTELEINYYVVYFRTMLIISGIWMMFYEMPDFFSIARNVYRSDDEKMHEGSSSLAFLQ